MTMKYTKSEIKEKIKEAELAMNYRTGNGKQRLNSRQRRRFKVLISNLKKPE